MDTSKVHSNIAISKSGDYSNKKDVVQFEGDRALLELINKNFQFDQNGDGKVDSKEFRGAIESAGGKLTSGESKFNEIFNDGIEVHDGSGFEQLHKALAEKGYILGAGAESEEV